MILRRLFSAGLVYVLWLVTSCAGNKPAGDMYRGVFVSQSVVIDGNDKEWPNPYPNFNSKSRISYIVANDANNLYVTVRISDEQTQRKMLIGGMKVWINARGKKEKDAGIYYPLKNAGGAMARPPIRDSGAHWQRPEPGLIKTYAIFGFGACQGSFSLSNGNACGIRVALNRNTSDELVWEASFPLNLIYPDLKATKVRDYGPVNVGFEIGGITMPAGPPIGAGPRPGQGGGEGMGGGMPDGGRGMPGGGMRRIVNGPHDPGGIREDAERLTQTTTIWTRIFIATH